MESRFAPVAKPSLTDDLAERIVEQIRSGTYQPGDRLPPIMKMARDFGVGHPTLRQALKKLEVMGVVQIRHGSGVYVSEEQQVLMVSNPVFGGVISKKLLLDLVEARMPIEVKAAGLAATEASPADLERMAQLLAQAEAHLDDDVRLSPLNMAFHRQIAEASGNVVLAQMQGVLTELFQNEQRLILSIYGSRTKDHREHVGLLEALRARDPELARRRMTRHLEVVRDVIDRWDPDRTPIT